MARYIDADKLTDKLEEIQFYTPVMTPIMKICNVIELVEDQPTADVEEVKHGKWIDKYGNKYANHLYVCSVCGEEALGEFYTNELGQTKLRQALTVGCPHCLAKMDSQLWVK